MCLGKLLKRRQHDMFLSSSMGLMQDTRVDTDSSDSEDDSDEEEEGDGEDTSEEYLKKIQDDSPMAIMTVVRCAAHTLQLAVYDSLKITAKEEIAKFRTVAKNLKSTRYLDVLPRRIVIKIDVVTRWNSTYTMIDSVLKQKKTLGDLYEVLKAKGKAKESDLKDVFLEEEEFKIMTQFVDAFKPIFECTQLLQTQDMPMSKRG